MQSRAAVVALNSSQWYSVWIRVKNGDEPSLCFSKESIAREGEGQKATSHHCARAFKAGWNKGWVQYNNRSGTGEELKEGFTRLQPMELERGWIQLNSAYGALNNRGIPGRSLGKGLGQQVLAEGFLA